MSTFTDGAPPSVGPEPMDDPSEPDHCLHDGADDPSADTGSLWLREEIQRRIAANNSESGGRHARRNATAATFPTLSGRTAGAGYVPRHSTATPGAGTPPPAPVRPPVGRLRRDVSADRSPPAWSGPPPSAPALPRSPQPGPPQPGTPQPGTQQPDPRQPDPRQPDPRRPDPRRPDPRRPGFRQPGPGSPRREPPPPGAPRPGTGIGVPSLPPRGGPAGAIPPLPAPPSGPAAARLLAPPPDASAPSAAPPLFPARPPRPIPGPLFEPGPGPAADPAALHDDDHDARVRRGPAEREPTDEVLWSASSPPPPPPPAAAALPPAPVAAQPPAAAPVVAVPEQRASDDEHPADPLRGARFPHAAEQDVTANGKRVRVVLAERKGVARPVRTVVDVQEGTAVGELLRSNLIGSQLTVAVLFALGAGLTLGVLPALFAIFPEIGRAEVLGLRLPWLILGVLVYPFLLVLGWWHTRTAERVEQNFADHVQE